MVYCHPPKNNLTSACPFKNISQIICLNLLRGVPLTFPCSAVLIEKQSKKEHLEDAHYTSVSNNVIHSVSREQDYN